MPLGITTKQRAILEQRWDHQLAYAEQFVRERTPLGLMVDFYRQATTEQLAQMDAWKREDLQMIQQWERENLETALTTNTEDLTEEQWEILQHFGRARKVTIDGDRPDMDQWDTAWVRI